MDDWTDMNLINIVSSAAGTLLTDGRGTAPTPHFRGEGGGKAKHYGALYREEGGLDQCYDCNLLIKENLNVTLYNNCY